MLSISASLVINEIQGRCRASGQVPDASLYARVTGGHSQIRQRHHRGRPTCDVRSSDHSGLGFCFCRPGGYWRSQDCHSVRVGGCEHVVD